MTTFREEVAVLLKEVGFDIESAEYMKMPAEKDSYEVSRVTGNINLMAGRFRIPSEMDKMVDEFISMPLP